MIGHPFLRRKRLLAAAAIPVLIVFWWWFRPEKLWITQKVSEPPPSDTSGEPRATFTGRFESGTEPLRGRATVYTKPDGARFLRLSDFVPPSGSDLHVLVTRGGEGKVAPNVVAGQADVVDCGPLKTTPDDQEYDLPTTSDLSKSDTVVIYSRTSHDVLGKAKLEAF